MILVLIGFRYLPGSEIDLERTYRYWKSRVSRILLLTDFPNPYWGEYYRIRHSRQMSYQIGEILRKITGSVILYYTGHGVLGAWKLPDASLIPISELLRWLPPKLLGIFDCCGLGPILVTSQTIITSTTGTQDGQICSSGSPFTKYLWKYFSLPKAQIQNKINQKMAQKFQPAPIMGWWD